MISSKQWDNGRRQSHSARKSQSRTHCHTLPCVARPTSAISPSIVTSVLVVPPEPTPPNPQRSTSDSVCKLKWEECYDVCAHIDTGLSIITHRHSLSVRQAQRSTSTLELIVRVRAHQSLTPVRHTQCLPPTLGAKEEQEHHVTLSRDSTLSPQQQQQYDRNVRGVASHRMTSYLCSLARALWQALAVGLIACLTHWNTLWLTSFSYSFTQLTSLCGTEDTLSLVLLLLLLEPLLMSSFFGMVLCTTYQ